MGKKCIVCEKDMSGKKCHRVQEDHIIRTIRGFKQFFRIAANNELVVCEDDMDKHLEKRKSFEKSMIFIGVLSAAVVILLIGAILLSGRFDVFAILSAFLIGGFIVLFGILFKYAPALEERPGAHGEKKASIPEEFEPLEAKGAKKGGS
jgi:hypothetical protein